MLLQRYVGAYPVPSVFVQVAVCGTFDVGKHYYFNALIPSFEISVQNTANVCKGYTSASTFSCYFIICFDLVLA